MACFVKYHLSSIPYVMRGVGMDALFPSHFPVISGLTDIPVLVTPTVRECGSKCARRIRKIVEYLIAAVTGMGGQCSYTSDCDLTAGNSGGTNL